MGYTESQIAELYVIRLKELDLFDLLRRVSEEEDPYANRYDASQPFYKILTVESMRQNRGRGPASEIEP